MTTISERDWRVYKKFFEVALERYCERVLTDAQGIIGDSAGSSHDRYLKLYDLMKERDKEIDRMLNKQKK